MSRASGSDRWWHSPACISATTNNYWTETAAPPKAIAAGTSRLQKQKDWFYERRFLLNSATKHLMKMNLQFSDLVDTQLLFLFSFDTVLINVFAKYETVVIECHHTVLAAEKGQHDETLWQTQYAWPLQLSFTEAFSTKQFLLRCFPKRKRPQTIATTRQLHVSTWDCHKSVHAWQRLCECICHLAIHVNSAPEVIQLIVIATPISECR